MPLKPITGVAVYFSNLFWAQNPVTQARDQISVTKVLPGKLAACMKKMKVVIAN